MSNVNVHTGTLEPMAKHTEASIEENDDGTIDYTLVYCDTLESFDNALTGLLDDGYME